MKTTPEREKKIESKTAQREAEWVTIHAFWQQLNLGGEADAVQTTMREFGCSKQKVLNAISFCLKFSKYR